jgi:hypothetical protein
MGDINGSNTCGGGRLSSVTAAEVVGPGRRCSMSSFVSIV